ncbi:MAG TPA: beta-ketoacyl-ACP synthase III [Methylovirgula sp.]
MTQSQILGTGSYAPSRVLTNSDLEKLVKTSDSWIVTRTGIRERHIAAEDEATSDMAVEAAKKALAMAATDAADLDMIIVGTISPDMQMPSCAVLVQAKLGATKAFAFDVSAACAGSLYGISIADKFIRTGAARRVLVIGAELLSRLVNWTDRNSCVLFGDAAGAVVMGPTDDPGRGLLSAHLHSDGNAAPLLSIPGGGSRMPATEEVIAKKLDKVAMNGREVYKFAVRVLPEALLETLAAHQLKPGAIDHVISHQANVRIVESVIERLGIPREKCWLNIDRYGNTSSASLLITLDEANRAGRFKPGDLIAMMAIGAGIAWGSALMRW